MENKFNSYFKIFYKKPISFLGFMVFRFLNKANYKIIREIVLRKYVIHPSVSFWENTKIYGSGKIQIGENTYLGRETFVNAHPDNAEIIIGKRCAISHGVHIRTSGYNVNTLKSEKREIVSLNIIIGDDVWIGSHVFIKGGVTIGNNVAIGSNSVVVKNIPSNCVVAGIPARIIKNL